MKNSLLLARGCILNYGTWNMSIHFGYVSVNTTLSFRFGRPCRRRLDWISITGVVEQVVAAFCGLIIIDQLCSCPHRRRDAAAWQPCITHYAIVILLRARLSAGLALTSDFLDAGTF